MFGLSALTGIVFGFVAGNGFGFNVGITVFGFFILFPLLYFYLFSVERCMIKLVSPLKLREGDWLVSDVKLGSKVIKKDVHGLSLSDIEKLRKAGKSVLIKKGIPFTPAFLIAFLVMVFFLEALESLLIQFLAVLF